MIPVVTGETAAASCKFLGGSVPHSLLEPRSLPIPFSWVHGDEASSPWGPYCPHLGSSIPTKRVILLVLILQIIPDQHGTLPEASFVSAFSAGISM